MLIMLAERCLYTLALCFMCVSSNDESFYDHCETQTVSARLGSSVLLPCNFRKSSPDWVSWIQTPKMHLVSLTSEGRIKFLDPRHGRAKAFPNQGSEGNYSICIDELQSSDLGIYRCEQGHNCLQVAVQLLDNKGARASPEEPGRGPVQQQEADNSNTVYENDDHNPDNKDPTRNNCHLPGFVHYMDGTQPTQSTNFKRVESTRTKLRFHRELMSRFRQASFSRHYYVNQEELGRQAASSQVEQQQQHKGIRKNKTKGNCEYKNPIYNRSTDQLNQL